MTGPQFRKQFGGWFATSFWVDVHYALAVIGTLVVFWRGMFGQFDLGFAGFVSALWVSAAGNDHFNMPTVAE